jgi:hypothetical protein
MSTPHPWEMRRQARRMRRYGMQPMMMINSGDQLPDLIAVIIARWLWRYRSELAPLTLTMALGIAATVLHFTRPHVWPYLLLLATVVAWALALFGDRAGLALRSERIYAATVAMAGGSWLAAGTALGPLYGYLEHLLFGSALALAVPWWAHRRRRARVRVERILAVWPDIARAVGLPGSRVLSAIVDVWGWRARFALARGHTLADVTGKLPALESALGTVRGAVRAYPTRENRANRFELRVLDIDPHADAIAWPGPSVTTITEPIDLGPFEDAAPARVLFQRRHVLFGGSTGSGKSGGLNVLLGNLSACRDVVIWGVDLKRGMELGPWGPCLDRLATTAAQATVLLRDAVAVLEARADLLSGLGKRTWEPTPELPALVIVIDEYAELTDEAADAIAACDSIARRGRAVAVNLIAATQRPTQKAMGHGAVRSQMDVRICFRVRERKDVDLILGQGMLNAGWHAHQLNAPGKFLISAPENHTPQRARAYLLTDETVSKTASRHAETRPELDETSRRAIEEARHTQPPIAAPDAPPGLAPGRTADAAQIALWAALSGAPDEGLTAPELLAATGMSRPTLYRRLRAYVRTGRAIQVSFGRYRAANHPGSP